MINNQKVFGLLGLCMKSGGVSFGTQACEDLIQKNKLKLVIVAEDASDRTKRNFKFLCEKNGINFLLFSTIDELSKCIGKKNKAIFGIKNESLANQIYKIINGGDIIG